MKSIEEIKNELMIKYLNGSLSSLLDIVDLPKDDSLREFICKLGAAYAYFYAKYVDKGSHDLTRESSSGEPYCSYSYAVIVDEEPLSVTRQACYKDPYWRQIYIERFGE